MLKFIRGKAQQPSADRQRLQKELFAFRKTVHHGFPNKPTALAWDPELRLLAISTTNGMLKGRVITLCDNNSLHLWEINDGCLEEVKSQVFEGKLKKISAMCIDSSKELLLLGTEGGNVYFLNLKTFQMLDSIIYVDIVTQNLPSSYKITNPGAVEAIAEQPGNPDCILIGYTRGLIVYWDKSNPSNKKIFLNPQQLECLCWYSSGTKFISSHNDGSYAFWDLDAEDKPIEEPTTLYGPFPCKPITKLLVVENEGENLIVFSGGMPRASYSEKYTVTVFESTGKAHTVLDFTSKVIDFIYIEGEKGEPGILLVLAEEELIAVDLSNDDMKMILLPYLASLHASAVTCSYHVSDVPAHLYDMLKEAGLQQIQDVYSERKWPTLGGRTLREKEVSDTYELLLTGHEDGTVRFWDCTGVGFFPLYKFSSTPYFANDIPLSPSEDEDEWPPFKKIGTFDPYSDDPRLAVKKVWLCPKSGTLVVAGTAGHIIVATVGDETPADGQIPVRSVSIVSDRDNFVWKGHEALVPTKQPTVPSNGLQVSSILQLHPPASITAFCCSTELGLIAAGTAHGLALYDYIRMQPVVTKCTLNPNDLSGAGEGPISRRKSLKKSLRESFRRLRRGRTTKANAGDKRGQASPVRGQNIGSPVEARPVERQIEARPVDDSMGGTIRCVHIANTFLISTQSSSPTFWAGTNNGTVYAFTISMPPHQKRREADVRSQLGKEIQLKHRAPVLSVTVVDSNSLPLNKDSALPHRVLICSEEQFKVFTLPSLKPLGKLKLTAHEGCRVRKTSFAKFMNPDKRTSETCLMCLTNLGDCLVLNVPEFRRQLNAAVVPPEDVHGIYSLTFTSEGEAFYLHSSSEYQRISLSATKVTSLAYEENTDEGESEDGDETEDENEKEAEEEEGEEDCKKSEDGDVKEEEESKFQKKEKILSEDVPLLNGSLMGRLKPLENGVEEDKLDFSIGDITVDSVKEHITNITSTCNDGLQEEPKNVVITKTTTTTIETNATSETKKTQDGTEYLVKVEQSKREILVEPQNRAFKSDLAKNLDIFSWGSRDSEKLVTVILNCYA
ncbi:hypothetical protein RUM43_004016 [Polyplax serrata]|uniref:Lethal giant larvae homologue 2 domain-containing protein n=1 Tax=Polyplax serrata TaxID=468196 RepID=A0AAN8SAQ4_POLSC